MANLSILPCAPLRTSLPTSIASAISSSGMPCSRALPKWYSRQEWQFAPTAVPTAISQASPQPKASQTPPRSTSTRLARAQPSPSATPDPAKAKALLQTEWKARQSALAAEKQRIQYEIANSTGATREQWKYKLALWRLEKEQAQASARTGSFQSVCSCRFTVSHSGSGEDQGRIRIVADGVES